MAPDAFSVVVAPTQILGADALTATLLTVTVTVPVLAQVVTVEVPVTVYVLDVLLLQLTEADVLFASPVAGDHTYVLAPDTASVVELPLQIVAAVGVMVKIGSAFTVTVFVVIALQPAALVPVIE